PVNFVPTLWPSLKPVLSTLHINFPWQYTSRSKRVPTKRPASKQKFASSSQAWHIMINIGYQPGRGLGAELQGNPFPVSDEVRMIKGGLGYQPVLGTAMVPVHKKPWLVPLYKQFLKGPSMQGHDQITPLLPPKKMLLPAYRETLHSLRPRKRLK